ncbi:hypothetical protein BGX38DRAFT_265253 [Terfezia claveryi]|nr:hypothetical protein BGX38DRAFT_265253 [Terfezia claveryi]
MPPNEALCFSCLSAADGPGTNGCLWNWHVPPEANEAGEENVLFPDTSLCFSCLSPCDGPGANGCQWNFHLYGQDNDDVEVEFNELEEQGAQGREGEMEGGLGGFPFSEESLRLFVVRTHEINRAEENLAHAQRSVSEAQANLDDAWKFFWFPNVQMPNQALPRPPMPAPRLSFSVVGHPLPIHQYEGPKCRHGGTMAECLWHVE